MLEKQKSVWVQKISASGTSNDALVPLPVGYYIATADTPIYAKAYLEDTAGQVITMDGFAVRIA